MNATPHTTAPALRLDLVAGLIAATVVLPKAMAYATVAGLPVAAGLYTALIPLVVYALLGSSRVLSVTSTTTLAILVGSELAMVVPDGNPERMLAAAATLTLLVGIVLVLASVLRLGFIANFISTPVLTGFKTGIGLVIVLDQLPKLLGVHIHKQDFFHDLLALVQSVPQTSLLTLAVALATLGLLLLMEKLWPHSPAPLVAVAGGIAATALFGLPALGVSVVGPIPQGLPALTLPDLDLVRQLIPGAVGIALMSFTESIAAARAFARDGDPYVNPNRELAATGAANAAGALLGAMPAGGGTSQTAVVRAAGAVSQRASLVTAAVALAVMLLLAPLLAKLPNATLAAVVIVYSVGLIQPGEFMAIRRVRSMEFRWALVACLGVLLFGTLQGIVIAIIVSLFGLASQSANPRLSVLGRKPGTDILRPRSDEHPEDESFGDVLVLRPEGRIFFLNAQSLADQLRAQVEAHQPRVLVLDLSAVQDVEYSALQMLVEAEDKLAALGIVYCLAGLNPGVLDAVRHTTLAERLGRERLLFNAQAAIDQYAKQPAQS
ncbi:SulP family inorganic anion transporter [Chitinolyticbacter meiyuanensis]|uniref:SulP family inorganic anion transporter n=1 Tax=Chitinolyticbacter meiyuanensis TaxID=682798 RepID=UPI0011E5F9EC|nr:SulP family inorganic anion transporter [Chitinolyticbacter meiyuanensis]